MLKRARTALLLVGLFNALILLAFVLILTLLSMNADLQVRGNFVQLDRAGAIDAEALEEFHPSYGFAVSDLSYRNTVPRYIARPAFEQMEGTAVMGLVIAGLNALACTLIAIFWLRPAARGDA